MSASSLASLIAFLLSARCGPELTAYRIREQVCVEDKEVAL
jgi:hypothetical protein